MQLDSGQWIVIGLSAVLIAGYISGYLVNRRLAQQVLVWLSLGLSPWGKVSAGAPLSGLTTGGSLNVLSASEPFQRIEALFLLAPRENLLFWLFDVLRGRRDELILKISLRSQPAKDLLLEAGRRGDRNFQKAVAQEGKTAFAEVEHSSTGGLEIAYRGKKAASGDQRRLFFEKYGLVVTRLSVQRQYPHIFIRARLKNLLTQSAQDFISEVGKLTIQ